MSRSACGARRDLSQNKLSGEIPSAFSAMTALVALCARSQPLLWTARTIRVVRHRELSQNALGGGLPEGFSALKDLEFLCASRRRLIVGLRMHGLTVIQGRQQQ